MKIKIFTTGGTIDKDYSKKAGTYNFDISEPAVKLILDTINPSFQYEVYSLLKKDSLDMTEEDRNTIFQACKNEENKKIIITHGTDTMTETAKKLGILKNKTIILVGASKPWRFMDSDASFNLGTAIGALNIIPEGVYIAMHGRVFSWNKVKKNSSGFFEENNFSPKA